MSLLVLICGYLRLLLAFSVLSVTSTSNHSDGRMEGGKERGEEGKKAWRKSTFKILLQSSIFADRCPGTEIRTKDKRERERVTACIKKL